MDDRTCCPHEAEVHDNFGCAAWLGYYEPGFVGRCRCKTPRTTFITLPATEDQVQMVRPERRRYPRTPHAPRRALLRLVS
ncbi:MAG: hypothetical protein NVSMB64_30150 [Candidatus Velthaea sp.]